ncbi:MAG: AraC family transcriptional regulator [Pseudomonadota bacterium]
MTPFAQLAQGNDYRPYLRRSCSVGSGRVTALDLDYHKPTVIRRRVPEMVLSVQISPARLAVSMGGRARAPFRYGPGHFDLTPPNVNFVSERLDSGRTITIAFPKELVAEVLPGGMIDFSPLHDRPHQSDLAMALCRQLVVQTDSNYASAGLYSQMLVQTLIMELLQTAMTGARSGQDDPMRLSPGTLRLIEEHIDDNIQEGASLEELAAIVGGPAGALRRALKQSTGRTPYQFVLWRRLIRAQDLLLSGDRSIAQIAFDCGFSSQAHMTALFRSKLGCTPGQMRRKSRVIGAEDQGAFLKEVA